MTNLADPPPALAQSTGWKPLSLKQFVSMQKYLLPASTAFGALLILVYLLSIGHLPGFDLASLAGTFVAAAFFAIFSMVMISGFCLLPGAAARNVLANLKGTSELVAETNQDQDVPSYVSLEHPVFIIQLGLLAPLSWAWLFAETLHQGFGKNWYTAQGAYGLMVVAAFVVIFAYGHPRRHPWRVTGWIALVSLLVFVVVLGFTSDELPAKPTTSTASATMAEQPGTPAQPAAPAVTTQAATAASARPGSQDHIQLAFAMTAAISTALSVWWGYWHWRHRQRVGTPAQKRKGLSAAFRYNAAKWLAAGIFVFLSLLIFYCALVLAMQSTPDREWYVLIGATVMLTVANWAAFTVRTLKDTVVTLAGTAVMFFIAIPVPLGFPFMLPDFTVRSLGLGALRLAHITLDGKHCATLSAYGAICPDKDAPLQLTNANLLSRIGSTYVLELTMSSPLPSTTTQAASPQIDDAKSKSVSRRLQLKTDPLEGDRVVGHGCDKTLVARARRSTSTDSSKTSSLPAFVCIQIVVPGGDVYSYSPDGPRTYTKGTTAMTAKP